MRTVSEPEQLAPRWWRIWQGRVLVACTAAACLAILWAAVAPVPILIYTVLALWALVAVGVGWLAFAVLGWFLYRTVRPSLVAPVLVLATAALVVFSVPFRVGFALSDKPLADLASQCQPSLADQRIGVYAVRRVAAIGDGGCQLFTTGGFVDDVGLAYLPGGPNDEIRARFESIDFTHVSGDWYRFSAGW